MLILGMKLWISFIPFYYSYIFQPFTLCWTEFLQLKLRIPCQTERYITAYYGPEWMVPANERDWKTSPENVRPNGRWPPDLWPQVIQVYNWLVQVIYFMLLWR